jgi:hypothetical protein
MPHSHGALNTFSNVSMTFKIATLRRLLPGASFALAVQEAFLDPPRPGGGCGPA